MEPFSITCDTCQARLKVCDAAAIGQILTCPKCESMVLVTAPDTSADRAQDAEAAGVGAQSDVATESAAPGAHPIPPAADSSEQIPLADLAMPQAKSFWGPLWPTGLGKWGLAAGAAIAAVAVTATGWRMAARDAGDNPPEIANRDAPPEPPQPPDEVPAAQEAAGDTQIRATTPPAAKQPAPIRETPPEPTKPPKKPDNLPKIIDPPEPEGQPPKPPTAISDKDPARPSAQPTAAEDRGPQSSADLLTGIDLLDDGELFGLEGGFVLPADAAPDDKPAAEKKPSPEAKPTPAEAPPVKRPPLADVDVHKALETRVLGAQYRGVRLTDFVGTMSDLSGVPISLDLAAMAAVGVTPATRVHYTTGDTTISALVDAALGATQKRLAAIRGEHGVRITVRDREKYLPLRHVIDDLAPDDPRKVALMNLVCNVIAPGTWELPGNARAELDDGKLAVSQTIIHQHEIIVLLEKLRTATEKPSRNSFYDTKGFRLANRRQRATARLRKIVTINEFLEEPLANLVRRVEWKTGTHIAVDWDALRTLRVGRDTPAELVVADKPLSEALDALVDPLGLAWRAIDENTVEITNQEQLDAQLELEVYPAQFAISAESTGNELVLRIQELVAADYWRAAGGPGRLRFDENDACLVVLANQGTQMAVATALDVWREQGLAKKEN